MSESSESPKPTCPSCGVALSEAAGGLCPRCLMAGALQPTKAAGHASHAPPELTDVVAAFPQFEILEMIGAGGMGTVWRARQPKLHREVALKLLPASLAEHDPAFAERFEREGQLLARLHHPNIVAVHDSGRTGDFFYLVMELVDGVNLRQAMRASRFTPSQALAIVPKICEALQYAHDEGVLHRDIKPENILLDAKGRVKLVDFGIAKLVVDENGGGQITERELADCQAPQAPALSGDALTQSDATLGTPNYMAPEQIDRPADVDHRADIYSLGVVFYELLTGELPMGKFAPPSQKSASDPRLDGIVQQALEKERSRRQQSVDELRTQMETVTGTPLGTPPPPLAGFTAQSPHTKPPVIWPTALVHVLLMAAVCAALVFFAPRYVVLFGDMQLRLPAVTRMVIGLSESLRVGGVLILPFLAVTLVGFCFLARTVGGRTGLRWWTAAVVCGWVVVAVTAGAALQMPLRHAIVRLGPPSVEPSSAALFFGPVIERVLPSDRSAIDFQSGIVQQPDWQTILSAGDDAYGRWLQDSGTDAIVEEAPGQTIVQPASGVTGFPRLVAPMRSRSEERERCVFVMEEAAEFETVRPADAEAKLRIVSQRNLSWKVAAGSRPWWFQTLDGAKGVLQLMSVSDQPHGLKVRYKLVVTNPMAAVSPPGSLRTAMLPKQQIAKSEAALQKLVAQAAAQHAEVIAGNPRTVAEEGTNKKITALQAELLRFTQEWSKFEAVLARHQGSGVSRGEFMKAQNAVGTAEVRLRMVQAAVEEVTADAVFGPVLEQFIPANDAAPWPWFDIDAGKMIFTFGDEERVEDFCASMTPGPRALFTADETGFGTVALDSAQWDTMSAGALMEKLKAATVDEASAEESLPKTYAFTTRAGRVGMLQILKAGDQPRGLQIRYKLVVAGPAAPTARAAEKP